jgi:hypothetical protein
MFLIDRLRNEACSIDQKTFTELNFKERPHLQEWIAKNPKMLGEDLLIIQKEFSDFQDTNERLDLLALDKSGNLVVIENKLDDSGKDVVWQSLKYVSYCSGLGVSEITALYQSYLNKQSLNEKAEERILQFLDATDFDEIQLNSGDQRIILVAANFRKEVTSTVMWLLDHNIDIICIKVVPYQLNDQILIDTEQILPPPETSEFRIGQIKKKIEAKQIKEIQDERHNVRYSFWIKALPELQKRAELYYNTSSTNDSWITGATGYSGIGYNSVVTRKSARAELYISKPNSDENKRIFDQLFSSKSEIEDKCGFQMNWDRMEGKIASRIDISLEGVSIDNESDWPRMIDFLGDQIGKMKIVFSPYLQLAVNKM